VLTVTVTHKYMDSVPMVTQAVHIVIISVLINVGILDLLPFNCPQCYQSKISGKAMKENLSMCLTKY
jgi:hypothetical protein